LMVESSKNSPDDLKQKYTEIYAEIREIIDGTRSIGEIKGAGALSPKVRELIAIGSAIATQRGRDTVVSCVHDCLKAGVSREQIFEVLRLAILMAEVPAETYDRIVREAIDSFDSQD